MSEIPMHQSKKKYVYPLNMLDCFKGISMILIILSHCRNFSVNNTVVNQIIDITSSGATLFFQLAAGFGIRKTHPSKMFTKTVKEMLFPYLICALVTVPLKFPVRLLAGESLSGSASHTASLGLGFLFGTLSTQDTFLGLPIGSNGPAWFLLALFWGLQIVNLLLKLNNRKKEFAAALAITAAGFAIQHLGFSYFCIARGLCSVLPIYLGFLLRKEHYLDRIPKAAAWILPVLLVIEAFLFLPVVADLPWLVRGAGLYSLWAGEVLLMLQLSVWRSQQPGGVIAQFCRFIGRNSLLFLMVHTVGYSCMPWGGFSRIIGLADIPELGNMLCFALRLCVCAVLVRLLDKPFRRVLLR